MGISANEVLAIRQEIKQVREISETATSQLLKSVAEVTRMVEELKKGFPDGDAGAHCRYHDSIIEAIEERKAFRKAVIEKTTVMLLWAAIVWLGVAVWHEIRDNIPTISRSQ